MAKYKKKNLKKFMRDSKLRIIKIIFLNFIRLILLRSKILVNIGNYYYLIYLRYLEVIKLMSKSKFHLSIISLILMLSLILLHSEKKFSGIVNKSKLMKFLIKIKKKINLMDIHLAMLSMLKLEILKIKICSQLKDNL